MRRVSEFLSHKTIYIDIDEEITSIVDRIRKSKANEVIIVAPKRALLIQSLINLQLLKKESNRRKKKVMIVTQDRIGKKLIEKAGILVQANVDRLSEGDEDLELPMSPKSGNEDFDVSEMTSAENEKKLNIGSDSFFADSAHVIMQEEKKKEDDSEVEGFASDEAKAPVRQNQRPAHAEKVQKEKMVKMSDIVSNEEPRQRKRRIAKKAVDRQSQANIDVSSSGDFSFRESQRRHKVDADNFFKQPAPAHISVTKEEKILKTTRVKGKAGKYFVFFGISFLFLVALASAYYFLPKATVVLSLANQEKSISQAIESATDTKELDSHLAKIPALREEVTKEKSVEFKATGSKPGSGNAVGNVVIYNEFSAENQTLVETTRLETADGKIFRITKNVVVPGMTQLGGERKPGAIEVSVVADKPGEEFNISEADFKIPGFKGGPKYDKFYGKISKAMSGGGEGASTVVTTEDLAKAKEKIVADAKDEVLGEWRSKFGANRKYFDTAVKTELQSVTYSEKVGSQAEKFTANAKVKVTTLSFLVDDVRKVIEEKNTDNQDNALQMKAADNINYLLAEANLDQGFLKFEAKTDAFSITDLDLENFKKGVLGKKTDQVEALLQNYPAIKKIDVKFWPFFADRVPLNEKRVKIELDSQNQ